MPYFVRNKSKGFPLLILIIMLFLALYNFSSAMEKEDKEKPKNNESKVTSSSSSSSMDTQKVTFVSLQDYNSSSSSSSQHNKNGYYKKESAHCSPKTLQKRSITRTRTSSQDCTTSLNPIRTNGVLQMKPPYIEMKEGGKLAEEDALVIVDENELLICFEGLQKIYSDDIMDALIVLLLGTFPNGLEKFKKALAECPGHASSLISLNNSISTQIESPNPLELLDLISPDQKEAFTWGSSSREAIARALTMRDVILFRSLKPTHLIQQYIGDKNVSKIVSFISDYFNATSDWIASKLLKEANPISREALLLDVCYIGRWLFTQQNYHGAFQIMAGLNKTAVTRLWEMGKDKSPGDLDIYWGSIASMMSPFSNYKDYRAQLNNAKDGLFYLPALNLVLSEIEFTMNVFRKEPLKALGSIAKSLALLPWGREVPHIVGSDLMLKYVCAFRQIDTDNLWELSYLLLEDISQKKTSLPKKPLDEWTAPDLACFFKSSSRIDILQKLYLHDVFTGKDLIDYWQLENLSIVQKRKRLEAMGLSENMANTIISSDLSL
jgi:hypothetical protein